MTAASPSLEGRQDTVLIVDDSRAMRMIVRVALREAGYDHVVVLEADSGASALEVLARGARPTVILVDLHMPEMDGLQFMDEARKDIRGLRFGLITAAATESVRARARAAGAAFVLAKPFSPIQLQTALLRFGLKPGAEVAFDMVHEVASQVTSRRAGLSASGLQRSLNTLFQVDVRVTGTDKLNVRARFRNVVCAYRDPQGEIVAATVIDWTLAPRLATALSLIHKNVAEDVIATSTLPPHLAENLYEVCNVLGHVVGDGQELTAQPLDVKPQRPDREVIRLARAKRLDVTVRLAGSGSGPMAILTSG